MSTTLRAQEGSGQPIIVPLPTGAPTAGGTTATTADVAAAIRNSGLTEAQVRARLQAAGFDPRLADQFFQTGSQAVGARTGNGGLVDPGFAVALKSLGLLDGLSDTAPNMPDSTNPGGRDDSGAQTAPAAGRALGLFGKNVFSGGTTAFDPLLAGPVDAGYRLGVGDQLQLIITGDVEQAYALEVRRDGTVFVPQIGQVTVAGLTVEAARSNIKQRAGRVYSVVEEGRAHVDLTVSRVRNNQVFVVGEVERPGSYQINALGTVFRALASAGGPTERGTFRDVEVRRGGNAVAHVDLYTYLLHGDASNDVRTEQGDIIFVGLSHRLVVLSGAVRRPGTYELRDGENIATLMDFGGGLLATAAADRLQIDRVLPPAERAPGKERSLLDVPFNGNLRALDTVSLYDHDVVTVFPVGDVRRNRMALEGEVFEPGVYEWRPGLSLGEVITKSQGFRPWALTDRIKVERQIPFTGRTEMFSVNARDSSYRNFQLEEYDHVTVLDARKAYPAGTLAIGGSVVRPGQRTFVENMTLGDFIDLSGGFRPEAAVVELARRHLGTKYNDTSAVVQTFQILPGGRLDPKAAAILLEREDRVNVRDFPGYRVAPRSIILAGLFTYPGTYVLRSDAERVSDIVRRASGLLPSAYPAGARLIREGRPVAIDLAKALKADPEHDVYLSQGDRLEVGPDPSVVYVAGAVQRQVIVPFHPAWGISDYVSAAGGYASDADKNTIVVEYPSGEIRSRHRRLFHTTGDVPIISGSTITVGQKPDDKGINTGEVLTRTAQIATTLVSLIIGYKTVAK